MRLIVVVILQYIQILLSLHCTTETILTHINQIPIKKKVQ